MTDNDIIKALESCSNAEDILVKGQTYKNEPLSSLFKDALDLINRQKAEIEEHRKIAEEVVVLVQEVKQEYAESIAKTRAEAITEFAERVTMHFGTYTDKDYLRVFDMFRLIKQIAKEMKEGVNNA